MAEIDFDFYKNIIYWVGQMNSLSAYHLVYLPKNNEYAVVLAPYVPTYETGFGRICLSRLIDGKRQPMEIWYVDDNGRGFDGSQIVQVIEGQYNKSPEEDIRATLQRIERLLAENIELNKLAVI